MNRSAARFLTRVTYFLLILCATFITLLVVFLSQLDLNNYRLSLEQQISSALKQPVQIGHSSLTYNQGLALELQQVQIGPDHAVLAQIPRITATLQLAPLLDRKIVLSQVQIDTPNFQFWLPFPERPAKGASHQLLNSLGISILSIHNANLKIYQKQGNNVVERLEISNLHTVLRGWQPGKTGHLVVTGQLPEYTANFLLETRLPSSADPQIWREEEHKLRLQVKHFSAAKLPKLQSQKYPQALNFDLGIQGVPATGTHFNAVLSGSGSNEQIFSIAGSWTSSSQLDSITKLNGKLLKIPLNGEFFFLRQPGEYSLVGNFGAEDIKLNPELLKAWRIPNAGKLLRGDLDRLAISLKKTWDPTKKIVGLPRLDAETTISNLDWDIPELKQIQDFSAALSLRNQTLHIADGILVAGGHAVDFSGQIKNLFLNPKVNLKINFNPDSDDLKGQLKLPGDWDISGNIPGSLNLTGSLFEPEFLLQTDLGSIELQLGELFHKRSTDRAELQLQGRLSSKQLQVDHFSLSLNDTSISGRLSLTGSPFAPDFLLQTDLGSIELQYGELFHKRSTDRAKLQLQGHLADNRLQLDQFSLDLNDVNISGSGYFQQIQGEQQYHFTADPIDLNQLKHFSTLLQNFQIRGEIEPTLSRQQAGIQGTLKLQNVGAHLTPAIPDLNNTTGTIKLDRQGGTFQNIKTSLGKSDLTVSGTLRDWENPQLNLDLSGKKIRAQDLIFPESKLTFYNLNGQMQINAEEIIFSPINAQLEENTRVTINGNVSNFRDPLTTLEIQSDRVDVLDIIKLFAAPDSDDIDEPYLGKRPALLIKVSAKQGTLGGLYFQNAEATIRGEDNRLTIYPLKFNSGEGWCQTRVEFNHEQQLAPLKVSGHIEKVDASVLHQDLFDKPGLINGSLTGDFYLEGIPHKDLFWQSAKGGIHAQISDGTLREFHVLAKIFSLLNISQLLTGNLPDMDEDGMPVTLLDATIQIDAGKATTKDLTITSEAMNLSLVGTHNLIDDSLDFTLGVMPLRTVDKIITSVPIAGWVLTGKNKALVTAHFKIEGTSEAPEVTPVPIESISKTIFGLMQRTLSLPIELIKDLGSLFEEEPQKKVEP